jgi:phenylpropionate dioxygenase-like ring-hydroxylating dioxygenase large terminal subunit
MRAGDLVEGDGEAVSPVIFSDPSLYELEQTRIFGRAWLLLGHVSQLPEPGSFLRTFMGEEAVLVTRDREGRLHAFLNACRHRGFEVCQEDRGVAHRFQCRYHGWVYGSDGRLVGVPGQDTIYYDEIDKRRWGLVEAPRLETYKGLIFGCFDPEAPTLEAYLGEAAWYLDIILDRTAGGTEMLGPQRWRIAANWKVVAENHAGDEYHIGFAHGSGFPPDLGPHRATPLPFAREIRPGAGHGFGVNIFPEEVSMEERLSQGFPPPPHVADYLIRAQAEVRERLGARRASMQLIHGAIWPNFGMVPIINSLRVIHPRGPCEVEMWSYSLVDRDAPADVKAWISGRTAASFGPAGSFEQDDAANWASVTRSSRGAQWRRAPLNMQMGLGHEARSADIPGDLGLTASEICQRGFYQRWRQEMAVGAQA